MFIYKTYMFIYIKQSILEIMCTPAILCAE